MATVPAAAGCASCVTHASRPRVAGALPLTQRRHQLPSGMSKLGRPVLCLEYTYMKPSVGVSARRAFSSHPAGLTGPLRARPSSSFLRGVGSRIPQFGALFFALK